MTEQTRRNVLRYGIAIDLVIMAAGVGMLLPATPALLIGAFAVATALSVWRGGWQGGMLAGFLSLVALALVFPDVIRPVHLATFIALGLAGSAAVAYGTRPRRMMPAFQPAAIAAASAPIAVPNERSSVAPVPAAAPTPAQAPVHGQKKNGKKQKDEQRARREAEARQRNEADIRERQARLAREREEALKLEKERAAAEAERRRAEQERLRVEAEREQERERVARELEAQLAREREEAQRLEAERVAAEEARLQAEQERERIARELEEKLAREREEAQRLEAERIAAEQERERIARELEAQLAREREEAQRLEAERIAAEQERERIARELEAQLAREREEAQRLAAERAAAEEARLAAEEAHRQAEAERQRLAKELEEQLAREREEAIRLEAERREAEEARARAEEERQRVAQELEERVAREREEARIAHERVETERRAAEEARAAAEAERQRLEKELEERVSREATQSEQLEAGRRAAEEARVRAEAERLRIETELEQRLAQERQTTERDLHEQLEAERRAAEEDLRRQLEAERAAIRAQAGQEFAAERARIEKDAADRVAEAQRAAEAATANVRPPRPSKSEADAKPSLLGSISGWFKREPASSKNVNLSTKRLPVNGNASATKRPVSQSASAPAAQRRTTAAPATPTRPRLLFIERRRGTAEPTVAKLRQRNVDVQIVERWVDAVDEIFRFRPSALFLDVEHPEFDKIHKTLSDKTSQLPVVLTGRSASTLSPNIRYAAFVTRPYDGDDIARIAQVAFSRPEDLLAEQSIPRTMGKPLPQQQPAAAQRPAPAPRPVAPPQAAPAAPAQPQPQHVAPPPTNVVPIRPAAVAVSPNGTISGSGADEQYEVTCFSCRAPFDAVDADWCSCLAKERSLVCTNCLSCFCKAPPAYKEKFWVEAPPRLFERKTAEGRRQDGALALNLPKEQVTRPLVLTVEDDEEIQAIVQRVCSNLGYGFIWANNGQDGLDLAREYKPNLILSDAFMPKLDGREMCRILKEEPIGAEMRMVVMTGLYTDTKYRSEAVKRFHVDDYIAKPVAITDLINLLQKHLEGVTGLPQQEDLHELHRMDIEDDDGEGITLDSEIETANEGGDVPLSEILEPAQPRAVRTRNDSYDVACFNCQLSFDATRAEWCSCVGRDNTLVCEHCHGCFCKAPAAYRERFWIDAPPSLFERKMIGSKRALSAGTNPLPNDVKRPLILLVEDDENVQLIVRTVVSSMGYGFVVGANGQEGLSLAREYNPDLILSDAFMPKLDGREMCRLLKEDPMTARAKAIIMTGLYTDRKYRNEALDYFKVDDYVAKPLAVDDLIKLFKKHLPQELSAAN
jgi:CheY-like chemotaxis protein